MNKDLLVIGLGSVLMQDEGIGVRVVEDMESRYHIPKNVELMDGGTSAMDLLAPLRNREQVIIVDAVNTGAEPGTLVRIENKDIPAFFQTKISNHQLALSDLLATLRLTEQAPKNVVVLGIVPYQLENKLSLSEQSLKKMEELLSMVITELATHGIRLEAKDTPSIGFWQQRSEFASCSKETQASEQELQEQCA